MKRYFIYARVSSDMQTVDNQTHNILKHIEMIENGPFTHFLFTDPDTTTHIPMEKRAGLQKLLSSLKRGDTVVVTMLDRLSRPVWEMTTIYHQIAGKGCKVISLGQQNIEPWMIGIFGSLAEKERDNTRDRTLSAMKKKRETGERTGSLPYGYMLDLTKLMCRDERLRSHGKPYLLIENPEEQIIFLKMVELFQENRTYCDIVNCLTACGYFNRKGNPFNEGTVFRILRAANITRHPDLLREG